MRFRLLPLLAAISLAAWAAAAPQDKKPQDQPAGKKAAEAPKKKEYVGSETCAGCHDEISTHFTKKNPHALLETNKKRGWETKACEACHGPGSVHAESNAAADIRSPKNMKASAIDEMCLSCHKNQPTHVGRLQSSHARNSVSCTSCHNMHKQGAESSSEQFTKASGINRNCASCHMDVWASFQKPHRHRLPEGAMSCTSCHNPHTSFLGRNNRLTSGNEPGCFKCHSDKRGPFVFEHAPVRNEPCSICHEPPGSANPRMMTRSEVGNLCLECHSNIQSPPKSTTVGGVPPAIHDMRSPRWRNCTACHQKVHGSNVNRSLVR
jgi:DmsE family decaheme c-type cytochrome